MAKDAKAKAPEQDPVPTPVGLPANERGLSPADVARWDKARADLLNPNLALRETQRDTRVLTMAMVEAAPKREAEKRWQEQALAETVRLAEARGEAVAPVKPGSPVRVLSRGGLRQAYEDGHLKPEHGRLRSDDLWEAGRRYRDCYEVVEGLTTGDKGGGGGFGPKAPQPRIIEAGDQLLQMRAALTARQIAVLDLVCGQDKRLRAAAEELRRGFLGARNSLRGGLAILATLKVERRSCAEIIRAKTAAIAAAATGAA